MRDPWPGFDPAVIRERTRAYYDALARTYFERFRDELAPKAFDRAALDAFAARVGPGGRVCDAGCGPCGHVARHLTDAGLAVTGIDLSSECVAIARAAHPGLRFETMAMEATTFPDASLDGLIAYYSVIYTPRAALPALGHEFRRVLRPGGTLLVVVKEGEGEGFVPDPMGSEHETFFANFTQPEIADWLAVSGFRVLSAETREPYLFEFPVRRVFVMAERPLA